MDFRKFLGPNLEFSTKKGFKIHDPRITWYPFGTKNHVMRGPPVVDITLNIIRTTKVSRIMAESTIRMKLKDRVEIGYLLWVMRHRLFSETTIIQRYVKTPSSALSENLKLKFLPHYLSAIQVHFCWQKLMFCRKVKQTSSFLELKIWILAASKLKTF